MVFYNGVFHVLTGKREEYIDQIKKSGLIDEFRRQKGNLYYHVGASLTNNDDIIVCDGWEDEESYQKHVDSGAVVIWHNMYHRYVVSCNEREIIQMDETEESG